MIEVDLGATGLFADTVWAIGEHDGRVREGGDGVHLPEVLAGQQANFFGTAEFCEARIGRRATR